MQKMFVIHYYINKQILDSYLRTKSEKIWLLFTFVLNWVFLRFPWIFIVGLLWCSELDEIFQKFCPTCVHIILRLRNFRMAAVATENETKFHTNRRIFVFWWPFWIQNGHHNKPTMDINSQHHNLLGNQISPKSKFGFQVNYNVANW
jgi:hypothetical protein